MFLHCFKWLFFDISPNLGAIFLCLNLAKIRYTAPLKKFIYHISILNELKYLLCRFVKRIPFSTECAQIKRVTFFV